jgi:arsenate reductase (thioredoxin)
MRISELARRAGVTTSAVRWYEQVGVLPPAPRGSNGYRSYGEADLARLRLVLSLRRLGLGPADAGCLAELCLQHGTIDLGLAPLIASQRAAIARQRDDLDRLESELADLELTIAVAVRVRSSHKETAMTQQPIRVLFVCTGNSARSQIGQALLQRLGGPDFEVESAGTQPASVNPYAIRALAEVGIDWSAAVSKPLAPFLGQRFDYVITVCDRARQACPVFPGSVNSLHWGLEDPAEVEGSDEQRLETFRRTRQELTQRLRPFVEIARRSAGLPVGSVITEA